MSSFSTRMGFKTERPTRHRRGHRPGFGICWSGESRSFETGPWRNLRVRGDRCEKFERDGLVLGVNFSTEGRQRVARALTGRTHPM